MLWIKIMKLAFEISLGTIKSEATKTKYSNILITIAAQIANIYGVDAVTVRASEIKGF